MAKKKYKNSVGGRIKYARTEAGLSQKELGKKLKLSDKAISAYEVDRALPSLSVVQKMSTITGRPVQYFLDEDQNQRTDLQYRLSQVEKELAEVKKLLMMDE